MSINFVSAVGVVFAFWFVGLAFWKLLPALFTPFASHMMRGVMIVSCVLIARLGYWDIMPVALQGNWDTLRDTLGGKNFSAVFNVPLYVAAYQFLKARWYLIPDDERHMWTWYNSYRHPERHCAIKWRK
jgi:hypothetical protein